MIKASGGEGLDVYYRLIHKDMGNGTVAYPRKKGNFYTIAKKGGFTAVL